MNEHAQTTWGLGEYALMAERLEPAAAETVERAGVTGEDRVLDLACGTGNAALIAARRGAAVVGVDFEPRLLDIAADRARAGGLSVTWTCADLAAATGSFSAVVSAFGVMYGPDQSQAAAAVARCCDPGARIGLTAWAPGSFMPAMGAALAPYLPPPPPGAAPPTRWGDAEAVTELLAGHRIAVSDAVAGSLPLCFADRAEAAAFLLATAGHVLAERDRLRRAGRWSALTSDLEWLVGERDSGPGHGRGVVLDCEYVVVLGGPG